MPPKYDRKIDNHSRYFHLCGSGRLRQILGSFWFWCWFVGRPAMRFLFQCFGVASEPCYWRAGALRRWYLCDSSQRSWDVAISAIGSLAVVAAVARATAAACPRAFARRLPPLPDFPWAGLGLGRWCGGKSIIPGSYKVLKLCPTLPTLCGSAARG